MSEPSQPTPTEPTVPPVPRYGEYAPEGYVPPAPVDAPMRPAPGYEYAAAGQPFGAASYPAQPGGRARKTWDLVLTVVLLVMAVFGAGFGVIYGFLLMDPELLSQAFEQQGYPGFNGDAGAAPAVLLVSHVVLFLIAVGGGIALLLTRRVAFWLPLACGVVAAFFFWGSIFSVVASDPGFISTLS